MKNIFLVIGVSDFDRILPDSTRLHPPGLTDNGVDLIDTIGEFAGSRVNERVGQEDLVNCSNICQVKS